MAKRKAVLSLQDMEAELGYTVNHQAYHGKTPQRFYSDLRLVSTDVRGNVERELEERTRLRYSRCKELSEVRAVDLVRVGAVEEVADSEDAVKVTRIASSGIYVFSADVHYGFGYDMSLLLTPNEAVQTLSTARLDSSTRADSDCAIFRLPREIRDKIYEYSIPSATWRIEEMEIFDRTAFPRSLGDPAGFYFPLSKSVAILSVSKRMRQEAISLVFRKTRFELDDMDDVVKFLIAIGRIGRENIESLQFPWNSRVDSENRWDHTPDPDKHFLTLPKLHVSRCVSLLQQCKRLKALRLCFEHELITTMPLGTFMTDAGISSLSCMHNIETVEICDLHYEPLEHCHPATWLKETLEGGKTAKKEGPAQVDRFAVNS